jgi:small neutral amino acid transporter SnatA (MarC family)
VHFSPLATPETRSPGALDATPSDSQQQTVRKWDEGRPIY